MFACIYTKKIIGASNIPYDINQPTRVGVPSSSIFLCIAKSAKKNAKTPIPIPKSQMQNAEKKKNNRSEPPSKKTDLRY